MKYQIGTLRAIGIFKNIKSTHKITVYNTKFYFYLGHVVRSLSTELRNLDHQEGSVVVRSSQQLNATETKSQGYNWFENGNFLKLKCLSFYLTSLKLGVESL